MDVSSSLEKLKRYVEDQEFQGYDPYDALNSPVLNRLTFNRKYLRIAYIQALKRSPLNLRRLLLIRKGLNPKAIGLFLWGYAKLYRVEARDEELRKIKYLVDLLSSLRSKGYSGNCWGYDFDWQSRAFFVPRGVPTIVNTSFIGHALLDAHRYAGMEKALDLALSIKDFILRDLNRTEADGTFCFSYTPVDCTAVHNANLLGASFLVRLFKHVKDDELRSAALSSLNYTMKYQKPDGSWSYAETAFQGWIDSFHTGFNLQSILCFIREGFGEEHIPAFRKGVGFYAEHFFLPDGTPKYYHHTLYPLDVHCSAQGAVFFSRMGDSYAGLAERIVEWMIRNLQDERGYFYYQKTRYWTNRIPYMRWSQAWAFHALTEYLLAEKAGHTDWVT